ncbi:hypothetical protein JOE69_001161 [Arthrobacter russicus]|uniref:Uncharacterized protein n=1 Tax=Arthrobacter russicus TaxID=172040 RepID=A0ABU1J932_9MICC|nr:hypothetical protein [Arthrobacter russicus]
MTGASSFLDVFCVFMALIISPPNDVLRRPADGGYDTY